jgi:hypothetical protein
MAFLSRVLSPTSTEPEPEPEPWTVRYTAILDNGESIDWERTYNFSPRCAKQQAAGNLIAAGWVGEIRHGVRGDGVFYPPHRIREITWEIL